MIDRKEIETSRDPLILVIVLSYWRGAKTMAEVTRRTATFTDMKGIWALVRQIAADFPVDLSSDAAQESMLSEIMVGCTSELSPVAVGKDKAIVGALIARRDEFEWGLRSGNVIHVTCAAIAPSHQD